MTAFPETRYCCDRCKVEIAVAMTNTPAHTRSAGAAGWLLLVVGPEPGTPATHLCEVCAGLFREFMDG